MKKLVVLGSSNIDHIAQMAAFPRAGQTLHGHAYSQAYGGKGANQAVAACKQGAAVQFISTLGEDAVGAEMLGHFAALGMDVSAIARVPQVTGMAMIWLADPSGGSIGQAILPVADSVAGRGCQTPATAAHLRPETAMVPVADESVQ